jgi:hypothetical protein
MKTFLCISLLLAGCQMDARSVDSERLEKCIEESIEKVKKAQSEMEDPSDIYTFYWLLGVEKGLEEALEIIENLD